MIGPEASPGLQRPRRIRHSRTGRHNPGPGQFARRSGACPHSSSCRARALSFRRSLPSTSGFGRWTCRSAPYPNSEAPHAPTTHRVGATCQSRPMRHDVLMTSLRRRTAEPLRSRARGKIPGTQGPTGACTADLGKGGNRLSPGSVACDSRKVWGDRRKKRDFGNSGAALDPCVCSIKPSLPGSLTQAQPSKSQRVGGVQLTDPRNYVKSGWESRAFPETSGLIRAAALRSGPSRPHGGQGRGRRGCRWRPRC